MDTKHANIVRKTINEEYYSIKCIDIKMIIMKKNGYINATKLCSRASLNLVHKKELKHWNETQKSKDVVEQISSITKIPVDKLSIYIRGNKGKNKQINGTYVHSAILTRIACWISPNFEAKVALWINEWKKYSDENQSEYMVAFTTMISHNIKRKEEKVQTILHKKYGGAIEVAVPVGYIDLLTTNYLIEIKSYHTWMHAIGQLMTYGDFHRDKTKVLYLFDVKGNDISMVKKMCNKCDIKVKIYD